MNELKDAIFRLDKAIEGRIRVDNAYCDVMPADVVLVCQHIKPIGDASIERKRALQIGSERARKGVPVMIKVIDCAFLVEEGRKLTGDSVIVQP
jgi:hypothetical protein